MNIHKIPIEKLVFAEYNPRKIKGNELEDLKRSIEKFGFVEPVIVNDHPERKLVIVGGHQRVRGARGDRNAGLASGSRYQKLCLWRMACG